MLHIHPEEQQSMNLTRTINYLMKNRALLLRFYVLRKIGALLLPKYRFKWPHIGWWNDHVFNEYLVKFDEIRGMNTDRRWMLYQLMRLTEDISGDTAECGVYKGAGSYLICKVNSSNRSFSRIHYLFDSFSGLSKPHESDGAYWTEGDLCSPLEILKNNLSEFSENISILEGWIPQRFKEVEQKKFSFVHIDVDLYAPTLDSMTFFYQRMNEGGIIVCDDYGYTNCPGATRAIDEFLKEKKEKMVALSAGGGFLIKGVKMSAYK
jgi:hypothetical protein